MVFMNDKETINQFLANVPILYLLKTSENRKNRNIGQKWINFPGNQSVHTSV